MNSLSNYHSCHQWITVEFSGIMTHPNFNSVDLFHFYLHATAQNFNSFHSILPINFHYELTCESSYYSLQHRIFTTHKRMISWHIRKALQFWQQFSKILPRSLCSVTSAKESVFSKRTGVNWSLLYCANADPAFSFNKLSFFRRTRTSLKTSLNSP